MKDESKPSNVACSSFVPHRFRATQCGRCFKSHAQHQQFMKGTRSHKTGPAGLDLHSRLNVALPCSTSEEEEAEREEEEEEERVGGHLLLKKQQLRHQGKGVESRICAQEGDDSGGNTVDYFEVDSVMYGGDQREPNIRPRRQIVKKSVARRTREAAARKSPQTLRLNISVEPEINNLSPVIDVGQPREKTGYDSISDNVSENSDNFELLKVFKNARNGGSGEIERDGNSSDSAGFQYLKALRMARKSAIPVPKAAKEPNSDSRSKMLQEFQAVAKNLRHVSNKNFEVSETNGNQVQAVGRMANNASPRLNRQDVEARQKIMEARSLEALANTAYETFLGHSKHDTLPRNLGTSIPRPSVISRPNHQRQLSDPECFQPVEKEEIQVVAMPSSESGPNEELPSKRQFVTSSKISSEIYFGSAPPKTKQPKTKQLTDTDEVFQSFLDHTEKTVMIVAADGTVSHYRGAEKTSTGQESEQDGKVPRPRKLTKPYKVVDVPQTPPQQTLASAFPMSPQLPLSPSPGYKSTEVDLNANTDSSSSHVFQFKASPAKFPKRNVVLVDGVYSVEDSVPFSQQDPTSSLSGVVDGETTPPFPILLSESESEHSDRRRSSSSSSYKVPIYIGPRNYDNVGTVLSDREASLTDLSKEMPGASGESSYGYLTPMRTIKEGKPADPEPPPVPVRTSSETQLHLSPTEDSKTPAAAATPHATKMQVHSRKARRVQANSNNSQSSSEPRWRSKTHPLAPEPIYAKVNVGAKTSNVSVARSNTDVGKSKQKRVAPLPPNGEGHEIGHLLPDTLPRGLPPPPPGKEKRRPTENDGGDGSPGRSVKPTAPSPPTESQLGVIYEAMDRQPVLASKASHSLTTASPGKPLLPSGRSEQQPPIQSQMQGRSQSPQGRHSRTPMTGRVRSPTPEAKTNGGSGEVTSPPPHKEVAPSSTPPRPTSPPIQCPHPETVHLPDNSPQHSPNGKEGKSKRSKLPWRRRRKRGDRGSPERDFDATVVEKWLEDVHQLKLEDEEVQRNSMNRLEVINAYRGESTAIIDHSDAQSPSLSTSPEHNGGVGADDSDGSGIRAHVASPNKRRAPKPPHGDRPASWLEGSRDSPGGSTEDFPQLQKSYSLSPHSKRRASDGDHLAQYENMGVLRQRQKRSAPPKPERRRRNMTTGFENLPSHREAAAAESKPPALMRQTSSDPDLTSSGRDKSPPDGRPTAAAPPLKSALKTPGSFETKKAENDPLVQPKRPVRIIAPEKDPGPAEEPTFVNIYSNIEIVQRGLRSTDPKAPMAAVVFTADAETQCRWTSPDVEATEAATVEEDAVDVGESLLAINQTTLARLASSGREKMPGLGSAVEAGSAKRRPWEASSQPQYQACCQVPGGTFIKIVHPDEEAATTVVMVATDVAKASVVLHLAQCCQTVTSHPNIMTICHTSLESVPPEMLGPGVGRERKALREDDGSPPGPETAVVTTDRAPTTTAAEYVRNGLELHEYLPEKYEEKAALLLLQLLAGVHHLQLHRVRLQSLKLDHLMLAGSGLPGGGSQLLINLLASFLDTDPHQDSGPTLDGDVYGSSARLAEKITEFEVGLLVYELLHRPNPFGVKPSLVAQEYEPRHLPPIPSRSRFSRGLQRLAGELLRKKPADRLSAGQAVAVLQCLLWGPPATFTEDPGLTERNLQRWLAMEQAKKVASMCELCIPGCGDSDTGYSLSDQLQCQFLSDTSPQSLLQSMELLCR